MTIGNFKGTGNVYICTKNGNMYVGAPSFRSHCLLHFDLLQL